MNNTHLFKQMEPEDNRLRIFAWNPNGIRALLKYNASGNAKGHLEDLLRDQKPDILFFPETKGNRTVQFETQCKLEAVFEKADPSRKWKWYWSYCDRAGRHGNAVAVAKDVVVEEVRYSLDLQDANKHEPEGRVLALKLYQRSIVPGKGLVIMGLYVPNASSKLSRLDYKVEWLKKLRMAMDAYRNAGNSVIVIGDINVAPDMRDLCNPSGNLQTPGYSKEERDTFSWLMQAALPLDSERSEDMRTGAGYVDVWRHKNPLPYRTRKHDGVYTFWSTRSRARERNAGWRIDLVLMDRETYREEGECVSDVMICPDYYGSDHCPIGVEVVLTDSKQADQQLDEEESSSS